RVTSLPSSFAAKAPPSALEATKSTLSLRRTPLFFDRHARVFCASYVDGDPQPAAATAATRTRGNSSLRGCTAADCRTQIATTSPLAPLHRRPEGAYSPACAEHGARVGRSRAEQPVRASGRSVGSVDESDTRLGEFVDRHQTAGAAPQPASALRTKKRRLAGRSAS